MSKVEELTWHLIAARTAKDNGREGLAQLHHKKAMAIAWW